MRIRAGLDSDLLRRRRSLLGRGLIHLTKPVRPKAAAEGCVAVLLTAGCVRLPETVKVAAPLHNWPVTGRAG